MTISIFDLKGVCNMNYDKYGSNALLTLEYGGVAKRYVPLA